MNSENPASMANFQVPVREYMTSPVISVSPGDSLEEAHRRLVERGVSALAVTEGDSLIGLISRTDLIRVGKREAGSSVRARILTLPARTVRDEMTTEVAAVAPDAPLAEAARRMREGFIHRVFVVEDGALVGVLGTRDLIRAIADKRTNDRIGKYMSAPVFTIRDEETIGEAVDRLDRGHVSGFVVVEDGWPVGVFGKVEALEARDLPRSVAVGDAMNPRVLVLPSTTKLHRAAAQAQALGVRRVIIHDGNGVLGILSGMDFAQAVA